MLTVTHLKKSVEGGQDNGHGEIIWINEVECFCHGNENLIIHTCWYTLHIQTSVCSCFEPSSQSAAANFERQHAARSKSFTPAGMFGLFDTWHIDSQRSAHQLQTMQSRTGDCNYNCIDAN